MENSSINWLKNESETGRRARQLSTEFFARSTTLVAPDLLGKIFVVREKKEILAARIVETEAYRGDDPASHSFRGKTPRSEVMFGDAGVSYVYFIYGMYEMLNFVTEVNGFPGAVLIRAAEPLLGEDKMRQRRPAARTHQDLLNGPGKLCRAMGIRLKDNGLSLGGPRFSVIDDGFQPKKILVSPRVGITQAKDKMWRYFLDENPFVSRAPQNKESRILKKK
jgi:DNA-3-methyladenine glycosylase